MNHLKKLSAVILSLVLAAGSSVMNIAAEEGNPEFDAFCEEQFIEEMEQDYMSMHFTVKDYEKFSITKPELIIGDASWESYAEEAARMEEILKRLDTFDYDSLSAEQKITWRTYKQYVTDLKTLNEYPEMDGLFETASGIQDSLLTNFTEYRFYREEDFADYLTVLASVDEYLNQAVETTKKQAAGGYFLRDDMLDMALESIAEFTAKKEDSELIVTFEEKVDEFEGLSEAEKQEYKQKNREIVLNSFIPAFERTAKELEKLRGSRSFEGGVANYKNGGREYYEALVRVNTSSDDSIEEQFEDCTGFLEYLVDEYIALYMKNPNIDDLYMREEIGMDDPDEILEYLQNHLDDFPDGPKVTYEYDYLDPSVANESVTAYYMQPPIDDIEHNVVRINKDAITDVNDLYATLAHEAFPGHLYQTTWALNTVPVKLRSAYGFFGYQEGWGMYSEWCAWDFSEIDPDAAKLNAIYIALSYVEDAAVDLAVNGMGWDTAQVSDWMESIGLNGDNAQLVMDYVIQRPGLILPYGIGMMRFIELRNEAEEEMGRNFNLKEFHTVLLSGGDRPFDMVEEDVEAYIDGTDPQEIIQFEPDYYQEPDIDIGPFVYDAPYNKPDVPAALILSTVFGAGAVLSYMGLRNIRKKGPFA